MENQTQQLPETLTWKAMSKQQTAHSPQWYLGFTLGSIALLAFAIFYDRSIITIITFVLLIGVVYIFSTQSPQSITYKITTTGLSAGSTVYPYKIIKQFWILYNPPEVKKLCFMTTAYLNNQIVFELGNQDPLLVKLVLAQYLPEDLQREESLTEALARKLKI